MRNNSHILILLIFLIFFSCSRNEMDEPFPEEIYPVITPPKGSLISEDHTAEGFMVQLKNKTIIHFFRLDPGENGSHIGNNSRIVKRISLDNGETWSAPSTVFEDNYDDRNVHGGITDDNLIVVFFRRYDADQKKPVDLNYIISSDDGINWSDRKTLKTNISLTEATELYAGGRIIKIPNHGYMQSVQANYYTELHLSKDGNDWDSIGWIWDYREDRRYCIDEGNFAYVGEGRLIGLFRDDEKHDTIRNYFQVTSNDYGKTWTSPERTNIAKPFFCPMPTIIYDSLNFLLITIATDRKEIIQENALWIYINDVNDVIGNPNNYTLYEKINRPEYSEISLYGYPTFTKINHNDFLVVFTDRSLKSNQKENANFYQFCIQLKY